jgi:hypothetical protein
MHFKDTGVVAVHAPVYAGCQSGEPGTDDDDRIIA